MKTEILIGNMIELFIVSIILYACVSFIFNLTAFKQIEKNRVVTTTKEVVTFLGAFFLCFFIKKLRIFGGTSVKIPSLADLVITSLLLAKFSEFVGDIFYRIKRGD